MQRILIAGPGEGSKFKSKEFAEADFVAAYSKDGEDVHIFKSRDASSSETIPPDLLLSRIGECISRSNSRG